MKGWKLVLCLAAVILVSTAAVAQDRHDSIVMVVDVSETVVKSDDIETAKRILQDMNSKFPDYVQSAGVMEFGNLAPPTSEWVLPVGQWDRTSTANALSSIEDGDGGTAIGAALKNSAPGVDQATGKTALLIVSDGKNNGTADPVQVVRDMKAKHGADLCVFTIQLGDDAAGQGLLSSLVDEGQCGLASQASMLQSDEQIQSLVDYIFPCGVAPAPKPAPTPKDTDGDGVVDSEDKCPGTFRGAKVDYRGCWVIENVQFASGSAEIQSRYYPDLNNVAEVLKANPGVKVVIEGHTDSQGSDESNQVLSQQRAESVMSYLIGKGVDPGRLSAVGYGETKPIGDNETNEGRAQNRRIELQIER